MYAKKSLGQNFLTSSAIAEGMVREAHLTLEDKVLEIGPGKGILTGALLKHAGEVIAVEKDRELVRELVRKFYREIEARKLSIIEGDILKFDFSALTSYAVVANIPYNITGEILRLLLTQKHQPKLVLLMVQKEVAERIVAKDGESLLSLSVKCYGTPTIIRKVSAGSFSPRPKVDSAILKISGISRDFFAGISEERFFAIIKAGFAHKRKILWGNLSEKESKFKLSPCWNELGLTRNTRAEELSLETWKKLVSCLG